MRGQIRVGRLCWDLAKIGSDSTNLCFWLLTIERLQFWGFLQMYEIAWSVSELAECCEQSVPLLDRQTTNKTGGNETKASQIGLEMKVRADDPELQIRAAQRSELVRASLKFQNARALNFSDGFSTDLPNSKTEMASYHRMASHQLRKSFLKNPVLSYHGLRPLIFCPFDSNFCKNNFNVYRKRIICMISNRSFQDLKYPSRVIYCRWNIKSQMLKLPRLADSWYLWR